LIHPLNIAAAATYWVIVAVWLTILGTLAWFYFKNPRTFGTTRLFLAVLAIDAVRNLIENVYFGLYFGAKYGVFSSGLGQFLGIPGLLILPKMANIAAGCIVLSVLLLKWLPQEIRERLEAERQVKYLHELSTIDGMTGLYNRRQFMILAEAEWQRSRRYERALSLATIDIDNFKSINDRFGHNAGDQVIIMVAELARLAKRETDIAGRLGGEEFAILLPETAAEDARIFAERLRGLILQKTAPLIPGAGPTSVSIGLSESGTAQSVSEFFKQADTALYEAKRGGRNQVCRHRTA
jgi:diguanylate cyclase (GGDEF)-like protein